MKDVQFLKAVALGVLTAVCVTPACQAQEGASSYFRPLLQAVPHDPPTVQGATDALHFRIQSHRESQGVDKRLLAPMYEGNVKIIPLDHGGRSANHLILESGVGILIFKAAPADGIARVLGYMPFNCDGVTITIKDGVTTLCDERGRKLQVFPIADSQSVVAPSHLYRDETIRKARIYNL